MKILQINTRYSGGGGASGVANSLHDYLNNNTIHESKFLYGRGSSNNKNSIKINFTLDVYFSAFNSLFFGKSLNLYFDDRIDEYIKETDLIHLHNIHGYYVNYSKLLKKIILHNKPVVWTLHDMWPITGRCAFPYACSKWIDGCKECTFKLLYPKTYFDRSRKLWLEKNSLFNQLPTDKTTLVSPSRWLAGVIKNSFLSKYKLTVIPNGIDIDENTTFSKEDLRKELNLPLSKKLILFVAADINDERKGIKFILDIINRFGDDILFVSVGKKIPGFNNNKLLQIGYISDKSLLFKIYKCCDLYVNPSLAETFSLTTAEAMGNGQPVVAFDSGPLSELVSSGCGVLVKSISSEGLYNSINELISNKGELSRISKNCIEKFKRNYTLQKFVSSYLSVYESICNQEI